MGQIPNDPPWMGTKVLLLEIIPIPYQKVQSLCDAPDTTHEITKLIKKDRLNAMHSFVKQKTISDEDTTRPGIHLLCSTRWIIGAEAMQSIIINFVYEVLMELWEWSLENCSYTDTKAKFRGVSSSMEKVDFFFGLCLGECILKHADTLSQTVTNTGLTVTTLQRDTS